MFDQLTNYGMLDNMFSDWTSFTKRYSKVEDRLYLWERFIRSE